MTTPDCNVVAQYVVIQMDGYININDPSAIWPFTAPSVPDGAHTLWGLAVGDTQPQRSGIKLLPKVS
jgi:hypothetical protein